MNMNQYKLSGWRLIITSLVLIAFMFFGIVKPVQAHGDDLSVAQFLIDNQQTKIQVALPTTVLGFADDNFDNQLSATEIEQNQADLTEFIADRLILTNQAGIRGKLTVEPSVKNSLPYIIKDRDYTHSQLFLRYSWDEPIKSLMIDYGLFSPKMPLSHCIASIFAHQHTQNYIFSQRNRQLSINTQGDTQLLYHNLLITIAIAFIWGSFHALSPGHGKSMVVAYLVSSKATTRHAVFLGLMTTATHTLGIFALGIVTLLLSKYILPEQLYPFLGLISGLGIVIVAGYLFKQRVFNSSSDHPTENHHHHDEDHKHEHNNTHNHDHLPVTDNDKIDWSSLITLGISSGLVPCPAALILLLGTISLGNIGLGILLVLVFSLGLAVTLISVGIISIKAKDLFNKIPNQINLTRKLAIASPVFLLIIGILATYRALQQLPLVI